METRRESALERQKRKEIEDEHDELKTQRNRKRRDRKRRLLEQQAKDKAEESVEPPKKRKKSTDPKWLAMNNLMKAAMAPVKPLKPYANNNANNASSVAALCEGRVRSSVMIDSKGLQYGRKEMKARPKNTAEVLQEAAAKGAHIKIKKKYLDEKQRPREITPAESVAKRLVTSGSTWAEQGVSELILKALNELGFVAPTPIQRATLKAALSMQCIIAAAQTGSGKTLAFGVPVIHHIVTDIKKAKGIDEHASRILSCLIVCPTRELSMQIRDHIIAITKYTTIKVIAVVGGVSEEKQKRVLKSHPHVLVCTPGRVNKLLKDKDSPFLEKSLSKNLKYLVLDEADRLLEQHHFSDLTDLLHSLNTQVDDDHTWGDVVTFPNSGSASKSKAQGNKQTRVYEALTVEYDSIEAFDAAENVDKQVLITADVATTLSEDDNSGRFRKRKTKSQAKNQQRLVFITSATITLATKFKDGTKKILKWCGDTADAMYLEAIVSRLFMKLDQFKMVDINPTHKVSDTMKEYFLNCLANDRDLHLYYFLCLYPGRTLIFVNSISCLRRLFGILSFLHLPVYPLHSKMQQRQRMKNLDRFKENDKAIIIATDVVGRGIDVPNVFYVVHYQLPLNTEIYTHRAGRTARASKAGLSLALVTPAEMHLYKRICHSLDYKEGMEAMDIDMFMLNQVRARIDIAIEMDKLSNTKNKRSAELHWYEQTAKETGLDIDDELIDKYVIDPHERKVEDLRIKECEQSLITYLA